MPKTHRSAVIALPGHVKLDHTPTADPRPNEVRVRLEGCGVCGSNLPVWEGRPWFEYPLVAGTPGHEAWGVIEKVGPDVRELEVGNRVAMLSHHAFAEVDIAPSDCVVKLPSELDDEPFPGEALGCAMNVFERADLHPGQRVAIIGIGFLGAILTQLARNAGAEVIAISRRTTSLDTAAAMGANHLIPLDDHGRIIDDVRQITGGGFCERVIEVTGHQWPLDLAAELCAERATLVIAGYHQDGPRQVNMQLWNWRGLDVINAHERDPSRYVEGMRAAVNAVLNGTLNPAPLYTHRFALDHLSDALDLLRDRTDAFIKSLITYD
jgi:threonine dehydrogenase-like Zn-dependent dehydrogenase